MRPVPEHVDRLLGLVAPLPAADVPLPAARGLVLAAPVTSRVDLPGFDNSAMDGYAVRVADCAGATAQHPVRLPVHEDIAAGDTRSLSLAPGAVARIMTGAPLPAGAEAVVPVESTDGGADRVEIRAEALAGQHIRRHGEDVRRGDPVVPAGTVLTPGVIALVAAANVPEVSVHRRPRVAIFSTGDELVDLGGDLAHGQIVDSNQVMLAQLVEAAGAELVHAGRLPDAADAVRARLTDPPGDPDLLLTSGGVSMGAHDTVKEVLTAEGTVEFVRLAMRPGMPQGSGTIGARRTPIITLPGNPVSSFVSFHVFVLPILRRLAGRDPSADTFRAVAASPWSSVDSKVEFTRVRVVDGRAEPSRGQGSHMLSALADANALAMVPADTTRVVPGDELECFPLLGAGPTP